MPRGESSQITLLLRRWRDGDAGAYDALVEKTHGRLMAIAGGLAAGDRESTSPGALVNEAYLRLRELKRIEWQNRDHFFAFAATQIRRVLIARARERLAQKRGGSSERVTLAPHLSWTDIPAAQILDLNRALDELADREPVLVRVVELHYLMGYSVAETAELQGTSESSVDRNLRFARAWLNRRLLARCSGGVGA